ncbi:hypothetical protein [Parafrankia discariae]|uniref:hypothetical protein n=1 Tax=Parafrankia discariae TaxID=365528 RepID=UPI00039CC8D3|nr:hypothetical protein [Parafrankia discariae]
MTGDHPFGATSRGTSSGHLRVVSGDFGELRRNNSDTPVRPPRRPRAGRGPRVGHRAVIVGVALAAVLAACGEAGGDTTTTRPEPAPAAAAQPSGTGPSPAAGPAGAAGPEGDGQTTAGAGSPGAGSAAVGPAATGSASVGAGPGTPGTDPQTGADPRTPANPRTPAGPSARTTPGAPAAGPTGPVVPDLPSVAPSPVFLGEACVPGHDVEPAVAVNGLVLYCAPEPGGAGAGSATAGRWSPEEPTQSTRSRPEPGSECDPVDVGQIVPGADGRPVTCLREPDGGMRWADVS